MDKCLVCDSEWFELPGIIGLGMKTMQTSRMDVGVTTAFRFKIWTGEKKYISIEVPGIHPDIFKQVLKALHMAKKEQDKQQTKWIPSGFLYGDFSKIENNQTTTAN